MSMPRRFCVSMGGRDILDESSSFLFSGDDPPILVIRGVGGSFPLRMRGIIVIVFSKRF